MKENRYHLGLVSVSFRQHSPKEILEATKVAGLSCIEWGSDVHAPCHDIARIEEIAALQKEYGIFWSSYGTYFRLGETHIDELEDYIQSAKILGTNILRLWCGRKSDKDMTNAEKNDLFAVCQNAAEIAENGVSITVEGDGEIGYTLPAFCFDGEVSPEITVGDHSLTVSYEGWICRYATNGKIIDLNRTAANRNGHYRAFIATAEGSLEIKVDIIKE